MPLPRRRRYVCQDCQGGQPGTARAASFHGAAARPLPSAPRHPGSRQACSKPPLPPPLVSALSAPHGAALYPPPLSSLQRRASANQWAAIAAATAYGGRLWAPAEPHPHYPPGFLHPETLADVVGGASHAGQQFHGALAALAAVSAAACGEEWPGLGPGEACEPTLHGAGAGAAGHLHLHTHNAACGSMRDSVVAGVLPFHRMEMAEASHALASSQAHAHGGSATNLQLQLQIHEHDSALGAHALLGMRRSCSRGSQLSLGTTGGAQRLDSEGDRDRDAALGGSRPSSTPPMPSWRVLVGGGGGRRGRRRGVSPLAAFGSDSDGCGLDAPSGSGAGGMGVGSAGGHASADGGTPLLLERLYGSQGAIPAQFQGAEQQAALATLLGTTAAFSSLGAAAPHGGGGGSAGRPQREGSRGASRSPSRSPFVSHLLQQSSQLAAASQYWHAVSQQGPQFGPHIAPYGYGAHGHAAAPLPSQQHQHGSSGSGMGAAPAPGQAYSGSRLADRPAHPQPQSDSEPKPQPAADGLLLLLEMATNIDAAAKDPLEELDPGARTAQRDKMVAACCAVA